MPQSLSAAAGAARAAVSRPPAGEEVTRETRHKSPANTLGMACATPSIHALEAYYQSVVRWSRRFSILPPQLAELPRNRFRNIASQQSSYVPPCRVVRFRGA